MAEVAVVGIDEIKDYVFKRGEWGGHQFKGDICEWARVVDSMSVILAPCSG